MKFNKKICLCSVIAAWSAVALFTACKTTSVTTPGAGGLSPTTNTYLVIAGVTITPVQEQNTITILATTGTRLALKHNPSLTNEFQLAVDALNLLLKNGVIDSASVTKTLANLKVSADAQEVTTSLILAYDALAGQLVTANITTNQYLSLALAGLVNGIQAGMLPASQ